MVLAIWPAAAAAARDPLSFEGIPGIKFEYYDVAGRTPGEIYSSMVRRAPKGSEGMAQTRWRIDVNWHEATRGSVCRVVEPRTRLSITVLLPRLVREDEATPEGRAFWRATIKGLRIHEAGHARIAWDHRDDFNRAAVKGRCKTIQRLATNIQASISAIQNAYDRDTDHGRRQTPPLEL